VKIFRYLIGGIFVFNLFACSTTGEVGTKFEQFFQSKRYKLTLKQRDSLMAVTRQLQTDTIRLGNIIKTFQIEYKKLNKEFLNLKDENLALTTENTSLKDEQIKLKQSYKNYSDSLEKKLNLLSEELKSKSQEISDNEKLLTEGDHHFKTMMTRHDSVIAELSSALNSSLTEFNSGELSTVITNGVIYLSISDNLLFKSGNVSVEDRGRKVLKKISLILNHYKDVDVTIAGNTDKTPVKSTIYKDNWDLSVARAAAIVRILSEEYDVHPSRLIASGRGEFFPLAPNENAEGRAKNRRTDIIFSVKLENNQLKEKEKP
jgi:chemotaxis protein MotB